MKIAIIDDTLDEFGGAERVALTMLRMFPESEFFTSFANPSIIKIFLKDIHPKRLHTPLQALSFIATHRSLIQLVSPFLWGHWDLSEFDLVLSNPSNLMCNMVSVTRGTHIQYIHTIPKNLFGLLPKTPLQRLTGYDRYISPYYRRAITNTPYILTSSKHMQQTIKRLFGIRAHILTPPVHIPASLPKPKKPKFMLAVSRIDRNKHLELAILACNALGIRLKIVGVTNEPSYERYLKDIAGPTIEFLGFRSDEDIDALYEETEAFLFPSKQEDFGIAPLEANARGIPVVAYYGGGPKETVIEGKTGTFFTTHNVQSMIDAIRRLRRMTFNRHTLYAHAKTYGEEVFQQKLTAYIDKVTKVPVTRRQTRSR